MNFHEAYKEMEKGKVARFDGAIYRLLISKWANGDMPEWKLYEHIAVEGYWYLVESLPVDMIISDEWQVFDLDYVFGDDIPQEIVENL